MLGFWKYVRNAIRTHPFNFAYLLISLLAMIIAAWSAIEARNARTASAADADRARKAADEGIEAARALVSAQYDTAMSVDLDMKTSDNIILLDVIVKNSGPRLARNVVAEMTANVERIDTNTSTLQAVRTLQGTYSVPLRDFEPGEAILAPAIQLPLGATPASLRLFERGHFIAAAGWAQNLAQPGNVLRICSAVRYAINSTSSPASSSKLEFRTTLGSCHYLTAEVSNGGFRHALFPPELASIIPPEEKPK